jgi:hypothetical protein
MSEIKVNKISPRTACGTVTLGDSGDTFTIPSGATINNQGTATNFGATGSASWTTTVKTGDFTAVAGEGYFVDTTSQEIDVALPAGTAGAVVAIADYAKNFGTNNCILVQNGSDKIGGSTNNAKLTTDGIAVTLIFIDSTKGWIVTDDGNQSSADTNPFMIATGGTESTSGNCKIHTFTGPGTFCVSKIATCAANNLVSYVVVAGGGGAGGDEGAGGGGAGGFREVESPATPYTASPLDGYPSSPNRVTVTAGSIPITVGAGGAGGVAHPSKAKGDDGSASVFSTITSAGGGGGGFGNGPSPDTGLHGKPGGSGGGSGGRIGSGCTAASVGTGNQPPTSPAQGTPGGAAKTCTSNTADAGGGGGGAGAGGGGASNPTGPGGVGGAGVTSEITASPVARAGGGGGGGNAPTSANGGAGGAGGGGAGGSGSSVGSAGTVNTGGGGGGPGTAGTSGTGGAGGSGIVIIRYKFQ